MYINNHIAGMPAGYLFSEIAKRVKAFEARHPGEKVIRMGIGDVTRPLSPFVAEAFAQAAREMATPDGFHGYGPEGGYPFLIEAIIKGDYASRGISLSHDEVFVSDGAKTDTAAIQELFSPDAVIAVTDPVYPVYVDANAMAGRLGSHQNGRWERLITLPCTHENGFVPEMPKERVDALYLCYPNNPTGAVLTHEELRRIVDWAGDKGTLIIYDAAYRAFIADDSLPHSIYEIPGANEVAVECCSFSKTAGFTGVRCAWMVVPKGVKGLLPAGESVSLNALWRRRLASKSNGVSYPVQKAAEATYLPQGQREIAENIAAYRHNAGILLEALNGLGLDVQGGAHAPYLWLKAPGGMTGWELFDYLLGRARLVGTPGEGFGPSGAGCFRLTAFGSREDTIIGAQRIQDALKAL
ncbi:MAG: LL-diaminopimelate aminotransferase [Eubacteriales bacterium]|nr:LL-diaminopimelate aminotransferase [Eubacteriales bacterium]